jgi:membrane-associated protease RseP (regulator of RpoE activity)
LKTNHTLHIVLFLLTFFTLTYSDLFLNPNIPQTLDNYILVFFENWPYSVSLLFILLAHEMGHYLPARYYGVKASLPFFIPLPFSPIGTMGAVIQIKEPIPDKKILFDIGVGGPIMSLILSLIAWLVGIHLSNVIAIASDFDRSHFLIFGDSLFTYFTTQWILGPLDFQTMDVQAHPLARAGWVGLLITAINLLPFGQLDGGHIIYSIFGESYRKWIHYLFGVFLFLALFHFTWLIWGFLIYYLIKVEHPFIPDSYSGLDKVRKALGIFMLGSLILIFVPKPIMVGIEFDKPSLFTEIYTFIFQGLGIHL